MAGLRRTDGFPEFVSLKPYVHKSQDSGPSMEGDLWCDLTSEQSLAALKWSIGKGIQRPAMDRKMKLEG